MKARIKILAALAAVSLAMMACGVSFDAVERSGKMVREERAVSGFNQVTLAGSGTLVITQGQNEGLVIEADENVLENIETRVVGDELKIGFKPGAAIFNTGPIYYYLEVEDLERIDLSGSGDVEMQALDTNSLEVVISGSGDVQISNLQAETLTLNISGSGSFDLDGEVTRQQIDISGSGKYRAADLRSQKADVTISGSGDMQVWVEEGLVISVSGSGDVEYYGNPTVNERITGSGNIIARGEK